MTSEIRTNSLTSRAGLSTVTLTDSGPMFSGITTFVDNSTFSVGTGGTIHAPATNVMALGTNNIDAIKIDSSGNVNVTGILTASSISGGVSVANQADNRLITATGTTDALNGESNLTYDGSILAVNGDITLDNGGSAGLNFKRSGALKADIEIGSSSGELAIRARDSSGFIKFTTGSSNVERLRINEHGLSIKNSTNTSALCVNNVRGTASAPSFNEANSDGFLVDVYNTGNPYPRYVSLAARGYGSATADMSFWTDSGSSVEERLRIQSNGRVNIGVNPHVGAQSLLNLKGSGDDGNQTVLLRLGNDSSGSGTGAAIVMGAGAGASSQGATISGFYDGTGTAFTVGTNASFNGSTTERFRIDSSGRVAINESANINGRLHVQHDALAENILYATRHNDQSNDKPILAITEAQMTGMGSGGLVIGNHNRDIHIGPVFDGSAAVTTTDTRGIRITYDGKLQVGNSLGTSVAGRFQVVEERGGQQSNDCNVYFETNANDWNLKTYYNSAGAHYHIEFIEQGATRGSITGNDGSNVTYNQGSDYRWKENIVDMTGSEGIEICKKLKPRKFNWIENREVTGEINTVDGFIAHEVVEAGVTGAVTGEKDAVNEDGSINGQMLDYGQMTPVLSAAIKGLIEKVETLEQDNIALRARVTNLEGE